MMRAVYAFSLSVIWIEFRPTMKVSMKNSNSHNQKEGKSYG
jgi:hypothetical protein